MARSMSGTEVAVYRAVITTHHEALPAQGGWPAEAEWEHTEHLGPFIAKNPAVAAINAAVAGAKRWNARQESVKFPGALRSASGHVERAELKWEAAK